MTAKHLTIFVLLFIFVPWHSAFSKKTSAYINVTQYGLVGDGIKNNTDALNNLLKTHNNLYFPKGVYRIDAINITDDNISIKGDGIGITILKSTSKVNDHTITVSKAQNLSINNLTIDGGGDRMKQPSRGDGASCLSISNVTRNVSLSSIEFKNAYNKQLIILGNEVAISNCIFNGDSGTSHNIDGIHLYGGVNNVSDIRIYNCKFNNLTRAGVYSDISVNRVEIVNSSFNNREKKYGGGIGVIIQGGGDGFLISENSFSNLSRAVNLRNGAQNITVSNNSMRNIYSNAIMLSVSKIIDVRINKEVLYASIKRRTMLNSNNAFNVEFKNIKIVNNSISFSRFGQRILEPNTSSFLLVSNGANDGNMKVKFSDIMLSGCTVSSSEIPLKSMVFVSLGRNDLLTGLNISNNVGENLQSIYYHGNSAKRVINLSTQ